VRQWAVISTLFVLTGLYAFTYPGRSRWGERADADFVTPANVRIDGELVYAQYGQRSMHLDLYRPAVLGRTPIPAVVVMRGGGFQHGDSKGFGFIAASLAQAGFAAACIQYRTSQEARFPAAVQDAKAAVRWLRANARDYRIDPDAVSAIGGSAGAYLAAMLATSGGVPDLEGDGGNAGVSSRVSAAVAMATPADFVDLSPYPRRALAAVEPFFGSPLERQLDARRRGSPISYVTRTSAPILLIHSDSDPDLPYSQALLLLQKYREAGASAELLTIPGGPHDPWNYRRWFPSLMDRAAVFLKHASMAGVRSRA
jgi:acetyl esterase/lipase